MIIASIRLLTKKNFALTNDTRLHFFILQEMRRIGKKILKIKIPVTITNAIENQANMFDNILESAFVD